MYFEKNIVLLSFAHLKWQMKGVRLILFDTATEEVGYFLR
jgi:hypothetical protein